DFRIHPVGEPIAKAGEAPLDAADVADIGAHPDNHDPALAASMRRRISAIAEARPVNTASPIRKWPMFNSLISGIAAMGPTFSNVSPWPAWISSPTASPATAAARIASRNGAGAHA